MVTQSYCCVERRETSRRLPGIGYVADFVTGAFTSFSGVSHPKREFTLRVRETGCKQDI